MLARCVRSCSSFPDRRIRTSLNISRGCCVLHQDLGRAIHHQWKVAHLTLAAPGSSHILPIRALSELGALHTPCVQPWPCLGPISKFDEVPLVIVLIHCPAARPCAWTCRIATTPGGTPCHNSLVLAWGPGTKPTTQWWPRGQGRVVE